MWPPLAISSAHAAVAGADSLEARTVLSSSQTLVEPWPKIGQTLVKQSQEQSVLASTGAAADDDAVAPTRSSLARRSSTGAVVAGLGGRDRLRLRLFDQCLTDFDQGLTRIWLVSTPAKCARPARSPRQAAVRDFFPRRKARDAPLFTR
jgi:hypothetical protein